ncbi:MAG: hypothetical protein D6692_04770 [Planctomycetota bacterium]|nr:MAG: hypothetical protein D6692_04770 [Planctomycetota bacterium]
MSIYVFDPRTGQFRGKREGSVELVHLRRKLPIPTIKAGPFAGEVAVRDEADMEPLPADYDPAVSRTPIPQPDGTWRIEPLSEEEKTARQEKEAEAVREASDRTALKDGVAELRKIANGTSTRSVAEQRALLALAMIYVLRRVEPALFAKPQPLQRKGSPLAGKRQGAQGEPR